MKTGFKNLCFSILLRLLLKLCLNNLEKTSIDAYFITVDETKFHLVKSYLCRYGYMNENVCKQHADDSLKFMQNNARDIYRGLVIFQTMFNITRTGKIDEDTIMKMAKPRCGNKDFDLQFSSSKFLRFKTNDYSLLRKGLSKLTYSIRKYNPYLNRYSKSLSNEIIENMIDKAFQTWLKHLYGDVKVKKLNEYDQEYDHSNITIYFAEGNHGDSMLFDGIDGELAHSCSLSNTKSPFRGHIHFDDSENWHMGENRLMSVLMHQIGHLFGLDHSSNPSSVMSPLFHFDDENLLDEDIKNLRMILGLESTYNKTEHRHMHQQQITTKTTTTTTVVPATSTSTATSASTSTSTITSTTSTITTTSTTTTSTKTTNTSPLLTTSTIQITTTLTSPTMPIKTSIEPSPSTSNSLDTTETSTVIDLTTQAKNEPFDRITEILNALNSFEKLSDSLDEPMTSPKIKEDKVLMELENNSNESRVDLTETTPERFFYVTDEVDKPSLIDEILSSTLPMADVRNLTSSQEKIENELSWKSLMKENISNTQLPLTSTSSISNSLSSVDSSEEYEDSNESSSSSSSQESDEYADDEYEELVKLIMSKKSNQTVNNSNILKTQNEISKFPHNITKNLDFPENTTFSTISSFELLKNSTLEITEQTDDELGGDEEDDDIDDDSTSVKNQTITSNEPVTTKSVITSAISLLSEATTATTLKSLVPETTSKILAETTKEFLNVPTSILASEHTSTEQSISKIAATAAYSLIQNQNVTSSTFRAEFIKDADSDKPADLCNDPEVDAITRTEWGNAFIFKGDFIWHIRGLTKWRLFDYEGWPKRISSLFPAMPSNIDSAYLYDDQYHFTKNESIWKYKIVLTYPPKYVLLKGYPKLLKEEYPDIPFKSVDSAFSIASSIFFFKDYDFWQSDWNTNVTGKIPFKTNAAVSWRNPRLDSSLTEPLAYIVSNSSMYKFNYWSIPISQEALDIRYFLFDCVQANYKPHNPLFLGPSYKQAFLTEDVYSKEDKSVRSISAHSARIVRNNDEKELTQGKPRQVEKLEKSPQINAESQTVLIKNVINSAASSLNSKILFVLIGLTFIDRIL